MIKYLKDRFIGLGRDEDGVAFVMTLAVFFFLYLLIAGVYATGVAVRKRIQLQNACDAAAYSAAVVQADTLSRIATLNRAMSWTYVQMTRRQMDYIVYTWLKHTKAHYEDDKTQAMAWAAAGSPCAGHALDWDISDIMINGWQMLPDNFNKTLNSFADGLGGSSFYAASGNGIDKLKKQISADKDTIELMNEEVENLATGIKDKVDAAVKDILNANVPAYDRGKIRYRVVQSERPYDDYFEVLKNTEEDESRFLSFSGNGSPEETFEEGTDVWFVRGYERQEDGGDGIRRSYNHAVRDKLYSEWSWHSTKWICGHRLTSWWHIPSPLTTCSHSHENDKCTMTGSLRPKYTRYQVRKLVKRRIGRRTVWLWQWVWQVAKTYVPTSGTTVTMNAKCYADNDQIYEEKYYIGEEARPLILKDSYFGKAGTITVGLACRNENPWMSLLGRAGTALGLYSAFNPYEGCGWSWAFSSAKAGYKFLGEEQYVSDADGDRIPNRDYRVDWEYGEWSVPEQSWNLCQSDFDAVFVPVRCAETMASNGKWEVANGSNHLENYVGGTWEPLGGLDDETESEITANMIAGGTTEIDPATDIDPYVQSWDKLSKGNPQHDDSGHVTAKWRIGTNGGHLDWGKLADKILH